MAGYVHPFAPYYDENGVLQIYVGGGNESVLTSSGYSGNGTASQQPITTPGTGSVGTGTSKSRPGPVLQEIMQSNWQGPNPIPKNVTSGSPYGNYISGGPALRFPSETPKYYMRIDTADYKRTSLTKINFASSGSYILPLPQQLVDSQTVTYTQQPIGNLLGTGADTALTAMTGSSAAADDMATPEGVGVSAATNLLKFMAAGKAIGGVVGGAVDALSAMTGIAPNPFLTVLLKGPEYKEYTFTWRLTPRTAAESLVIKRIIAQLNNDMAVAYSATLGKSFFQFPKVFNLSFSPNANFLYRFKPAVAQNMTVNYTPSGTPAFYGETGAPDAVEISIKFLELEFWISGQYM